MITTDMKGESYLEIEATTVFPVELLDSHMFGMGWGISVGEENPKTETYVAMFSFQMAVRRNDWANMSLLSDMSMDQVREDPLAAQASAVPEIPAIWTNLFSTKTSNSITTRARRNLNDGLIDGEKRMKLGGTYEWAVGFFHTSGASAFSEVMELTLGDG